MVNMSAKFDEDAHSGLISIAFTRLFPCIHVSFVTLNFELDGDAHLVQSLSCSQGSFFGKIFF